MPILEALAQEDTENMTDQQKLDLEDALERLQLAVAKSRSEAIKARQDSGIEDEWQQDEEFYEGMDDFNRVDHKTWSSKPVGRVGIQATQLITGSTIFMNITRPYTESAAARVGDMLIPTDERSFAIKPTPIPSLTAVAGGEINADLGSQIIQAHPDDKATQDKVMDNVQAMAQDKLAIAVAQATKAQTRIDDWLSESHYNTELRAVIEDCAKAGAGVLKGPFPVKRKKVAYREGELIIEEEIKPASKRVDYWNFYPDGACGENIHNGGYCWERDSITFKELSELRGTPGYIDYQITEALKEGPAKATKSIPEQVAKRDNITPETRHMYEIWYGYLSLNYDDLVLLGADLEDIEDAPVIPAAVTLVNNRVIRAEVNIVETGEFPYDVMPWQPRKDKPWGRGIPRQTRDCQSMLKGAIRNMMDNAGRAGGPQVIFKQGVVIPANGVTEVSPWKIWLAAEDADIDDVRKAFTFVTIPMLQQDLERIVHLALRLAEITTGLPMLMQGHDGQHTPETVGGMQMLQNNSTSVLRRIARLYDDKLIKPHIRRYYTYLLQYGEDDEKGDFTVEAQGSTALVERDAQNQNVIQMGEMVSQPQFGIDPKKWSKEFLKAMKFDPATLEYDDAEWKEIVARMAEGPQDTSLQVAQMKAEAEMAKTQAKGQMQQQEQSFKQYQMQVENQQELFLAEIDRQVEMMKLSGEKDISLSKIEASLAEAAMKLRTQAKLALQGPNIQPAEQVSEPPMEPAGRAPEGQAFQK